MIYKLIWRETNTKKVYHIWHVKNGLYWPTSHPIQAMVRKKLEGVDKLLIFKNNL
jgi:hypothetical protein